MKKVKAMILASVSAYLATATMVGRVGDASAAYRDLHAGFCHYYYDNAGSSVYNGNRIQINSTTTGIFCPMLSDTTLSTRDVKTLSVRGKSGSAGSSSKTCILDYVTGSTTCDAAVTWSEGPGVVAAIDPGLWGTYRGNYVPYVYHSLTNNSNLYSLYLESW